MNWTTFLAMLARDAHVARRRLVQLALQTLLQPMLFVFIFGRVMTSGGLLSTQYKSLLLPGIMAISMMFAGIWAVAMPLLAEFQFTREIEDRLLAPMDVEWLAIEKIVAGMAQALVAGLVVVPIGYLVMGAGVSLDLGAPLRLGALALMVSALSASVGLTLGSSVSQQGIGLMFSLVLTPMIFFGCAWVFMNLFRGDIVDRSLHYYLLAPVRREILVLGKYIAGLVVSIGVFGLATIACLVIVKVPRIAAGTGSIGLGVDVMLQYLLVTALACVGYGALFLSIGLLFRNPVLPALMVYGWELINFLLPPVLKKLSVIHYLQSISPIHVPEGPFAILADPTPAWIGIPGLLLVTLGLLAFAAWRTNRLEIRYAGE